MLHCRLSSLKFWWQLSQRPVEEECMAGLKSMLTPCVDIKLSRRYVCQVMSPSHLLLLLQTRSRITVSFYYIKFQREEDHISLAKFF